MIIAKPNRLSRPSLSLQQPLSVSSDQILSSVSHAYPTSKVYNDGFILSPLLKLPSAFGYAYVGETFSCTLCANNEILPGSSSDKSVSAVRIEAEIKTPNSGTPTKLTLNPEPSAQEKQLGEQNKTNGSNLDPGQSLQKIVQFELTEEGSHVLAVSVTYSETSLSSGRVRTFRKLYQFTCKNCLTVRSKTSALALNSKRAWSLEAQVENCGEDTIVLEKVELNNREGFKAYSLNWDDFSQKAVIDKPILMPSDIYQVCFYVEEDVGQDTKSRQLVFGTLSVRWRGGMGNKGHLTTDPLGERLN